MEKKNYQKPAVQVINIGTVAIMQGSTESIPMGKPGSGNQPRRVSFSHGGCGVNPHKLLIPATNSVINKNEYLIMNTI